jgi:hypothetical protein
MVTDIEHESEIFEKNMIKFASRIAIAFFLCVSIQNTSAADPIEYEIRVGVIRTDNVLRTDVDEVEETIALLGLNLDVQHERRKIDASLLTDLEFRTYTANTFDDDIIGTLNADLNLHFVPETFSWVFVEQFGQLNSNPFQPDTPLNRENVNRFSTGPDFRLRMGSSTAIEVGGRLYLNDFEISDIDNEVLEATISLARALSPHRSLSLNVTGSSVEFDNSEIGDTGFFRDYDLKSAYFGFESEAARSSVTVNLGVNEIERNGETFDGDLIYINWDRDISSSTVLNLAYNEGLSDAADALGRTQDPDLGPGDPDQTAGVSDPFENRRFTLGISATRNDNTLYASAIYNEDEYLTLSFLDRNSTTLSVGLSRVIGSSWQIRLRGALQKTEYVSSGREDDNIVISAGFSKQFSRAVAFNLDFTRFDSDSSDTSFGYVDNTIRLTLSYGR